MILHCWKGERRKHSPKGSRRQLCEWWLLTGNGIWWRDSTRQRARDYTSVIYVCHPGRTERNMKKRIWEGKQGHKKWYPPKRMWVIDRDMLQRVLVILESENVFHLDSCRHLEFESYWISPLETLLQIQRELEKMTSSQHSWRNYYAIPMSFLQGVWVETHKRIERLSPF